MEVFLHLAERKERHDIAIQKQKPKLKTEQMQIQVIEDYRNQRVDAAISLAELRN